MSKLIVDEIESLDGLYGIDMNTLSDVEGYGPRIVDLEADLTALTGLTYSTVTFALGNQFSTHEATATRIGNVVTVSLVTVPSPHQSNSSIISTAGILPELYRPNADASAVYYFLEDSVICKFQVNASGSISTYYQSFEGLPVNRTNTATVPSITYIVSP